MHADHALAARIEHSVARDLERYASVCARLDESLHVATVHAAGGLAVFVAPGSPVNAWFGAGLDGPVDPADLSAVEEFYSAHGAGAAISLCPMADPSLIEQLALRGWALTDFENVLVRRLRPLDFGQVEVPGPGVRVRLAETPAERAEWALLSARAFDAAGPSLESVRLAEASAAREDVTLLIASVEDEDAAVGALWIDGDLGWMLGDATSEKMRGKGAQTALLAERMRLAARMGCELALAEARPGSSSQRNMERLGCSVAYTRAELIAPLG
jgi:GNAT superfamily N-acetyltransferase